MKSFYTLSILAIFSAALFMQSCDDNSFSYDFSEVPDPYNRSAAISDSTYEEGLNVYVIEEGEGPFEVTPNDQLQFQYTGRTEDGRVFTSTFSEDVSQGQQLFSSIKPNSRVIEGFRKGVIGMKEGERRIIEIASSLSYPSRSTPCNNSAYRPCRFSFDPLGETVIFDVELIEIF